MTPTTETDMATAIKTTTGPLRIFGGGTRDIGTPVNGTTLHTTGLTGITLYEPGALTLVAKAGTPLADIETALDAENQRLAFEPMDHRTLLGTQGSPTIGGVVAANASGARRIAVGACRDHMLGVRFIDGQGDIIKNGGRVMKNVTGYDLVKLLTGSYGTLGVLTEVSLKVLPKPETSTTLCLQGAPLNDSVAAMSSALGSPFEVTGAAMVSGNTYLRLEGFTESVAYRATRIREKLAPFGDITHVDHTASETLWRDISNVTIFADHPVVTRISVQPSAAPQLAQAMADVADMDVALDWGGGLMWFGMRATTDAAAQHHTLQTLAQKYGGHATLIKGPKDMRQSVSVFQPDTKTIAMLSAALRAKYDPRNILNPDLMT